jgi:hypothetical protein
LSWEFDDMKDAEHALDTIDDHAPPAPRVVAGRVALNVVVIVLLVAVWALVR